MNKSKNEKPENKDYIETNVTKEELEQAERATKFLKELAENTRE